jgi:hypothetical protein
MHGRRISMQQNDSRRSDPAVFADVDRPGRDVDQPADDLAMFHRATLRSTP